MRRRLALVVIALVLSLLAPSAAPPAARAVGAWADTAPRPFVSGETTSTATTLADGRVLVTGIYADYGNSNGGVARVGGTAWLYDPATDRWVQAATFDPNAGNANPVLIQDGRVFFAGGRTVTSCINPGCQSKLAAAQLYDPATDRWTPAKPLTESRAGHTATLLPDGTVLIVGGSTSYGSAPSLPTATTERYDPRADRWVAGAPLVATRAYHAAARLRDGRVLIVGGITSGTTSGYSTDTTAAVDLYDPAADRWSAGASLEAARGLGIVATTLTSGWVLAVGWRQEPTGPIVTTAAVYIPDADRWNPIAPLLRARSGFGLAALPGGRALLVGGETGDGARGTTDLYDPVLNAWVGAAPTGGIRFLPLVAPLKDGRIFVAGTQSGDDRAQIYTDMPEPAACFPETGKCVRGRFLDYWLANGGLARNGYPLSDERQEVLEDGRAYTVQYFERARLEYHPDNAAPQDVQLGQFGRRVALTGPRNGAPADTGRAAPLAGQTYADATGHNLGGRFLDYWTQNGGLAQFGLPLTEVFRQTLEDGREYEVQYFERARFELHPENAAPYDVLLGQFGRQVLGENAILAGDPAFLRLFVTIPQLQEGLGSPSLASFLTTPGAYQRFERGAMIWRGDLRAIYVLCGDGGSGRVLLPPPPDPLLFPDRWREGEPPGGGAGPRAGLYEPARGFGKLWRENAAVRDCLGYANQERETGYTLRGVAFARGIMLAADDPAGAAVYALRRNSGENWTYERFPAVP